jgi:hypothetical protein
MNPNSFVLTFLEIKLSRFSTLALFAFSISFVSLNLISIEVQAQTNAGVNTTFSRGNFSLQEEEEEKRKVQKDLADLMRKAISMGAEIPEISGFDEDNATLYVKVNVNNTGERMANASDFYFTVNYQRNPESFGVSTVTGSDAGTIVRLPESTYGLMSQRAQTGDPEKDSFINSFGLTSYSGECHGKIKDGESKECIITKSISSNLTSTGANSSDQAQIIENDTSFQAAPVTESPSFKPVEGTYSSNKSGIQVNFPQGWKGSEIVQRNITFLVLSPQISSPEGTAENPLPYIVLQISPTISSISSQMPQNGSMTMIIPISFQDIIYHNDTDLSRKLGCNFTTISSGNISINGTEGRELTYRCTYLPTFSSTPPVTTNGKALAIDREENQIIMAYDSLSAANFEKYLPELKSL